MRRLVIVAFVLFVPIATLAAMRIDEISWNKGNLETLEAAGKEAITDFVKQYGGAKLAVRSEDIGDFKWADLDDNGRYELLTVQDVSRKFFNALVIYRRDPLGNITSQQISVWMLGGLDTVVRDLRGNGKKELVVPTQFGQYGATEVSVVWLAVYAAKDDSYTEASRDFPGFYDREVLPGLDRKISEAQRKTGEQARYLGLNLTLERDKILRVIGRDPSAGLQEAYRWMSSDDPRLLRAAALTLQDIGGHEADARMANEASKRAVALQRTTRQAPPSSGESPTAESASSGGSSPPEESKAPPFPGTVVHKGGTIP